MEDVLEGKAKLKEKEKSKEVYIKENGNEEGRKINKKKCMKN